MPRSTCDKKRQREREEEDGGMEMRRDLERQSEWEDEGNCHIWSTARSRDRQCGSTNSLWCVGLWKKKVLERTERKEKEMKQKTRVFPQEDGCLIATHICPCELIQTSSTLMSRCMSRLVCLRPSPAFVTALKCKFDKASYKTRSVYTRARKLQQHRQKSEEICALIYRTSKPIKINVKHSLQPACAETLFKHDNFKAYIR